MYNTIQQIVAKHEAGELAMDLYVEDSYSYERVTVNIQDLLEAVARDKTYEVRGISGQNYYMFSSGDDLLCNAASLCVFTSEADCINCCIDYMYSGINEELADGTFLYNDITYSECLRDVLADSIT